MRLFITGANGFIGSSVRRLAGMRGHEVMCLTEPYRMANPPLELLESFCPDACIHCAWIATPGIYQHSPENLSHCKWSERLVEGLRRVGVRRFVILGSCAEYQGSFAPIREDHPLVTDGTPYAAAKIRLHSTLRKLQKGSDFTLAWPRIFFPYGTKEHPRRLFSSVVQACRSSAFNPAMIKSPFAVRDYVHVSDVAQAILLLTELGADGSFNVGTGRGITIGSAVAELAQMMGYQAPDFAATGTIDDKDAIVADVARLQALGWKPRHELRARLMDYVDSACGAEQEI